MAYIRVIIVFVCCSLWSANSKSETLWSLSGPSASQSSSVVFHYATLDNLSIGDTYTIPIHNKRAFSGTVTRIQQHDNGYKSVTLNSPANDSVVNDSIENNSVILTFGTKYLRGRIESEGRTYSVSGTFFSGEIKPISFKPAFDLATASSDVVFPHGVTHSSSNTKIPVPPTLRKNTRISSSDIAQIDVLFVFTEQAEANYQGDLPTYINYLMTLANQALADSNVYINLNNVGMVKVDYPSNEDANTSLADISSQEHQAFLDIANIRAETGADVVSLITADMSCGVAFGNDQIGGNARNMFHVVSTRSIQENSCSEDTFAHELGHNLGLGHSRPQEVAGGYTFDFALGHGFDNAFATLMTYPGFFNANFNKVLRFSNTAMNCNGYACGVERSDSDNGADAAFALNVVRFEAAELYQTGAPLLPIDDALAYIDDSLLRQCVSDTANTRNLLYADSLFDLVCDQGGIQSLEGLQYFPKLEALQIPNNSITSLLPLANLRSLSVLNASNNMITDLSPLAGLTNLNRLTLSLNSISDVNALGDLSRLREIELSENNISDISALLTENRRWLLAGFSNNPSIYCWQQTYFEQYLLDGNGLFLSEGCDQSKDSEDADGDGISNDVELSSNTNPLIAEDAQGIAQFSQRTFRVNEGEAKVEVFIERILGITGRLQVELSTEASVAQSGEDYLPYTSTIVFEDGESNLLVEVDIVDDNLFEPTETFTLMITSQDQNITDSAIVVIDDNEASIEWLETQYAVTEQDGEVVLVASRSPGATGSSSVVVSVSPETAFWGTGNDYLVDRGTLTFAEDETEARFPIGIFKDQFTEPEESFYVTLTNPDNANLGSQRVTRITITDGAAEPPPPAEPPPTTSPPETPPSNTGDSGGALGFGFFLICAFYSLKRVGLKRRRFV